MTLATELGLVHEILVAESGAASTATLPAGAETFSVLELGDGDDSRAFIRAMARRGIFNVTPPRRRSYNRLPTPLSEATTFWRSEPPEWWLERFVAQNPNWVYLSGHYSGELFNQAYYMGWRGAFALDFASPSAENNVLWGYYESDTGANYRLGDRCHTVLIVGCNAISIPEPTHNIQTMLSGGDAPPVVLGFADTCPTNGTERLVRHFVDQLARDWSRRADEAHVVDSWLQAARIWSGPGRRLGYIDTEGHPFGVRQGTRSPWEWEAR